MVESTGPGQPKPCNTVGLQDLGDVEGWDVAGGGLYLFRLVDGVYKRAPLPSAANVPWVLNFSLVNPFVYTGPPHHSLRKWMNGGNYLASLVPRKKEANLRNLSGECFVSSRKHVVLKLVPEFVEPIIKEVPPDSTLIFRVALGNEPTQPFVLVEGVTIRWDKSAVGSNVGIVILVKRGASEVYYTREGADVHVTVEDKVSLETIHVYPTLSLRKFLFVDQLLEEEQALDV